MSAVPPVPVPDGTCLTPTEQYPPSVPPPSSWVGIIYQILPLKIGLSAPEMVNVLPASPDDAPITPDGAKGQLLLKVMAPPELAPSLAPPGPDVKLEYEPITPFENVTVP